MSLHLHLAAVHLRAVHLRWPARRHHRALHWWTRQSHTALAIVTRLRPDVIRPAFGADPKWADELAVMRVDQAATDRTMLVAEDITETGFAVLTGDLTETRPYTAAEWVDAWPEIPPIYTRLLDATEVALTAVARRAGA